MYYAAAQHRPARQGGRLMAFEAAFGVVVALSIVLLLLYARSRKANNGLTKSNIRLEVELEAARGRERDLPTLVKAMSADMLKEQSESFKTVATDPMGKMMEELRIRIENLGKQNAGDREAFNVRMEGMTKATGELLKKTGTLSDILRSPQKRGRYAEMDIERVFEMAGLTKGTHYEIQRVRDTKKPDFVVHLSEDRSIIVDSKAPLDALWKTTETDDEAAKAEAMDEHVRAVKGHIKALSKKEYWEDRESSLDYVVMVMPEYALLPALERGEHLMEYALENKVVLVTPSTLMVLLRAVGLMWKQSQMAKAVRDIGRLSADLHARLGTFAEHYNRVGKGLEDAIRYYNKSTGSWHSRLLPAADRLAEMGATVKDMPELNSIKTMPDRLLVDKDGSESA